MLCFELSCLAVMSIHTSVHTGTRLLTSMHMMIQMFVYMLIHMFPHKSVLYAHANTVHMSAFKKPICNMHVCMHVCERVFTHLHVGGMHAYVNLHTRSVHTFICMLIHVCT